MTLWIAVLLACALAFALKLSGFLIPPAALTDPRIQRVATLLPVALLTALIVTQGLLGESGQAQLDARAVALAVAVVALLLRAPFLVVLLLAASTAALVRALAG
ncbi:MAG: AzlD domain-containing protein [Ornithinimicrobium sp.]